MKYLFVLFLVACGAQEVSVIHGIDGKNGSDGSEGPAGPKGDAGTNGTNGYSCTAATVLANETAPNGGVLVTCGPTSALLLNGTNGTNGSNGTDGHDGATGASGTPGTVITPVQFCSGTGSYPSTFPEVGFCIDDKLYAVYSDHGGFLTETKPGVYTSDGINSSCTFTVYEHCVVTH